MPTVLRLTALPLLVVLFAQQVRAENWPQWRGPFFNGSTTETNLPVTWSAEQGIVWATPMPGPSHATPVVYGERVFVTSVEKETGNLLALGVDAKTGKILWTRRTGKDRPTMANRHTMATPAPVTDGTSVFFLYGTGDLGGFDMDGKKLWDRDLEKEFGPFVVKWHYASSPLLLDGRLYFLLMQCKNPSEYGESDRKGPLDSFLLAMDPQNGKTLWKQVRPTDAEHESTESYITPLPYKRNGKYEIILHGGEYVTGHDAATGKEEWRWQFAPHDRQKWQRTVSSASVGDGMVFVPRPKYRPLFALKPTGQGTLPDSCVTWQLGKFTNDVTTPLHYRGRLFVMSGKKKMLTCLNAKTGEQVWQKKLTTKGPFSSSPLGADGKVYCVSHQGEIVVLQAGDEFKVLATNQLPVPAQLNSMLIAANGRLYLRAPDKLYCIGK